MDLFVALDCVAVRPFWPRRSRVRGQTESLLGLLDASPLLDAVGFATTNYHATPMAGGLSFHNDLLQPLGSFQALGNGGIFHSPYGAYQGRVEHDAMGRTFYDAAGVQTQRWVDHGNTTSVWEGGRVTDTIVHHAGASTIWGDGQMRETWEATSGGFRRTVY